MGKRVFTPFFSQQLHASILLLLAMDWGVPLARVKKPKSRGKLWYQLIAIGLTQWSHARCLEHIPQLLRGCAALDGRTNVTTSDYRLLIKLLLPIQLERYIISTAGFETGRWFDNNAFCILVELVSHGQPSIDVICEDYKVSPSTVEKLLAAAGRWCFIKKNSPKRVLPTKECQTILDLIGAYQKW